MSGQLRLRVEQTVDHFGPGLESEPYWTAELRGHDDLGGYSEWRRGYATWREALHCGLGELARRQPQATA